MCDIDTLRLFINERLSAVAEDILSVFVRTLVDYQRHLDTVLNPVHNNNNHNTTANVSDHDVRQLDDLLNPPPAAVKTQPADYFPTCDEALSPAHQERSEGAEPYGSTSLPFLAVKREDGGDSDQGIEAEPSAAGTSSSSSAQQHVTTTTQADHGTVPLPLHPASDVQVLSSDSDGELTEDSDEWLASKAPKPRRTVRAEDGRGSRLPRNEPPPMPQDPDRPKGVPPSGNAGEQPFGFAFAGKGNFDQSLHVQASPVGVDAAAGGENCFTCTFCGRGFSQMSNLKKHTMTHTGEKPFWCSVCGKGFNQKVNLKTHFRVHTGEKPFSCTVCGKSFNQHGTVKMHMRVHTGEKPYSCSICGKSFSQRGVLKSHMGIHIAQLNS